MNHSGSHLQHVDNTGTLHLWFQHCLVRITVGFCFVLFCLPFHLCLYLFCYIYKIYTPMITSQNSIRNVSVATDEGPSSKLALSEGGSRGNIES